MSEKAEPCSMPMYCTRWKKKGKKGRQRIEKKNEYTYEKTYVYNIHRETNVAQCIYPHNTRNAYTCIFIRI